MPEPRRWDRDEVRDRRFASEERGRPGPRDRRFGFEQRERHVGDGPRERPGPRDRRFGYEQRQRPGGRPGPRGPWDRERAPGPRGREWERATPDRPSRPPRGPTPAEVLSDDEEVVAGRRPVEEAFAARREARRLLVVPERRAALDQLVLHATTLRIPVIEVEGGTLTALTGFDGHQGIALVVEPRRWATIEDVLALARSRGEPPFLLVLDRLEDPQNVGTLLRSAEACGVHGVLFPTRGQAPISPAAVKTSAGAVEHLLLVPQPDLSAALVDLHARGLRIVGADGDASLTVREADLRGPIAIVIGSEGSGLHARVRRRVDLMARIPMRGRVASLNASVAGSIFLFEAASQRDLGAAAGAGAAEAEAEVAGAEGPAAPDERMRPGPAPGSRQPRRRPPAPAPASVTGSEGQDEDVGVGQAEDTGEGRTEDTGEGQDEGLLPEAPPPPEAGTDR